MTSSKLAPTVRAVFSQDGAVIMEIRQDSMFTSNPVGGRVLELLKEGQSFEDVVSALVVECTSDTGSEVDHELVAKDLREFVVVLKENGILEREVSV